MTLKRLAVICVLLIIAINLVIAATGNMHAGRHHPSWVGALSWLFTAALVALIAIAIVGLRRRRKRSALRGHCGTLAQASVVVVEAHISPMRVLATPILVSVAALGFASGCGASRTGAVGSHPATHHYTVKQVETAFAGQGVRLRRIDDPTSFGLVILRRPSESPFIEALVNTPGTRAPDRVVLNGDTVSFRTRKDRNVTVFYAHSTGPTVKAALAHLH